MAIDPETLSYGGAPPKATRSVTGLLSDLAADVRLLIRQEVALFKAELSEKLGLAGQGAALMGGGAFLAASGWLVLLAAAVLGLATVLPPWAAALIVAIAVMLLGAVLLLIGKRRLSAGSLTPERTLRSLREDEAWLLERLR